MVLSLQYVQKTLWMFLTNKSMCKNTLSYLKHFLVRSQGEKYVVRNASIYAEIVLNNLVYGLVSCIWLRMSFKVFCEYLTIFAIEDLLLDLLWKAEPFFTCFVY